MAKLTQFQDEKPVYSGASPEVNAKGYDALSQVFGNISAVAQNETINVLDEQSQIGMLQAKTSMNDELTKAQINLIHSPDLADTIRNESKQNIDSIVKTSYVSDAHRKELEATAGSLANHVDLMSAQTQQKQLISSTKVAINTEFPKVLNMIAEHYARGEMNQANNLIDDLIRTSNMALKMGALSGNEYNTIQTLIGNTLNNTQQTLDMMGKGNLTAQKVHELSGHIYGSSSPDKANLPSNEYTTSNAEHYDEESTKQKALSDIDTHGRITNFHELDSLKQDARNAVHLHWVGANQAKSTIEAGVDQVSIGTRFKELQDKTELSLKENGELNYYKNYYKRLENGEFINEMRKTSQGQVIQQQTISADRAIENSGDLDSKQKIIMHRQNMELEKTRYMNLWNGLHGDPKYVNLMTKQELAPVINSFSLGQSPETAIATLRGSDPAMIPYIADSMPTSQQRAVISIIGQAGDNLMSGLASDMIYANQTGYKSKVLTPEREVSSTRKVQNLISVNEDIASALNYLNLLPHDPKAIKDQGIGAADGSIEALTNTVLFKADRLTDYNLTNMSGYISQIGMNMKQAYSIYTDTNVVFNRSTLKLEDHQLASLGAYAKMSVYDQLQKDVPKMKFLDLMDRQPLMVVNTPNNFIAVIDSRTGQLAMGRDKRPLFFKPYTPSMLNAALHYTNLKKLQEAPAERLRQQIQFGHAML